jgi:hypothetical protein
LAAVLTAASIVGVRALPASADFNGAPAGSQIDYGDATGDVVNADSGAPVNDARADITSVSAIRTNVSVDLYMSLAQYTDGRTDRHWDGFTGPIFELDTNGDGTPDYESDVYWDPSSGHTLVDTYRESDGADVCPEDGVFEGEGWFHVPVPLGCIGDPASLHVRASMFWDTDPSSDTAAVLEDDALENGAWSANWVVPPPPPPAGGGYWLVDSLGYVYQFGDAKNYGIMTDVVPMVDIEGTPTGKGYWELNASGQVWPSGDAVRYDASNIGLPLQAGERAVSLSSTPDGGGYWIFTSKGRVFPYGDAPFLGDMAGHALNAPVIGSVATPSGRGYYMVATDGGIFCFGDAHFAGSMGGRPLNKPVVGLVPDPDGDGYWLDASDGGVFAFSAGFRGSMGGRALNKPVIGMVSYGDGYLMVAADGGVFDFSNKPFTGSLGSSPPSHPIAGIAALPGN